MIRDREERGVFCHVPKESTAISAHDGVVGFLSRISIHVIHLMCEGNIQVYNERWGTVCVCLTCAPKNSAVGLSQLNLSCASA